SQPEKLSPIIQDLSKRGLAIVYATDSPILEQLSHDFQIPYARTTVQIDAELDPISIRNKLANLENAAKMNGYAIGIMRPISMTTRQLETWIKSLADKAIELVPVSSILVSRAKQK
ncbi:MAG: divergent polysaccharide deacetylase family protein, partial [Dolichospermum sp.]